MELHWSFFIDKKRKITYDLESALSKNLQQTGRTGERPFAPAFYTEEPMKKSKSVCEQLFDVWFRSKCSQERNDLHQQMKEAATMQFEEQLFLVRSAMLPEDQKTAFALTLCLCLTFDDYKRLSKHVASRRQHQQLIPGLERTAQSRKELAFLSRFEEIAETITYPCKKISLKDLLSREQLAAKFA